MSLPAQPVDAASVIVARESVVGSGWECLMLRRHVHSDFAADVYVFPGGKVDPEDRSVELRALAPNIGTSGDHDFAFRFAAIRELFEEAGLLLATLPSGAALPAELLDRLPAMRSRLRSGEMGLLGLLRGERLAPAVSRLHAFSRWITPETFPRRYDTRFFVTGAPAGQSALHDAEETTDTVWVSPPAALEWFEAGRFPLVFATERLLHRLAAHETVGDLLVPAAPADLEPVMPKIVRRDADTVFLLPGDAGY